MRPVNSEDLYLMKWASDPQISPDGSRVLFGVKIVSSEGPLKGYKAQIYMASNGYTGPFTSGKNDISPRWSPCGDKIAFLSDRAQDKNQIYVMPLGGGEAEKLTSLKDGAGEPVWSPDGSKIAFSALQGHGCTGSPQGKDSDVKVITKIRYKFNGRGLLPDGNHQIFVLDIESQSVSQVTSGPYDCREPAWSPDGSSIAFVSARFEDSDLSSVKDIWTVSLLDGDMKRLTHGDKIFSSPSWSSDGRYIACYGHDDSYKGATIPSICLIDAEGKSVQFLTRASQLGVSQGVSSDVVSSPSARPAWSQDSSALYFTALERGRTALYSVSLESREISKVTSGNCAVYGWSKAKEASRFALAVTAPEIVGDIWSLDLDSQWIDRKDADPVVLGEKGRVSRLTNLNEQWIESVYISVPEEIKVLGQDGRELQAWVMQPLGMEDGKTYPLVVEIHGGPHSAFGFSFCHEFQLLASRGYGVIYGNPSGSTGYGQEFVAATHHDWGGKDYEDVMSFADYGAKLPWVDKNRMGVTGGSYGGYMTNWIVGHTSRFKAAVTQRSTCNRFSQFGTSDAAYMNGEFEFDGNPWDNPMAYLKRSPIMYVKNVETPLLLIHSEQDLRCPIGQAEEFFVALRKLRKKAVMVRFPNENHELSRSGKPKHRIERLEYILAWFDRYMGPIGADYSVTLAKQGDAAVKLPEIDCPVVSAMIEGRI